MDASHLPPAELERLLTPSRAAIEVKSAVPELRAKMLRDAACSLGVRGGLAFQAGEIRRGLEKFSSVLDKFSFQSLMTSDGMLPPVVVEQQDVIKQEGRDVKRSASVVYRMIEPARLVMQAPTWRDYMYVGLPAQAPPEMPDKSLLPSSDAEQSLWKSTVIECWSTGVAQANEVFNMNLDRLKRDYQGMLRYRMLSLNGMVKDVVVASDGKAVTGDDREMAFDSRTIKILSAGSLQPNQEKWR